MDARPPTPTAEQAMVAFHEHLEERARRIRSTHGPLFDRAALESMLQDRASVRFPTECRFDASMLEHGEFAHAERVGAELEEGFVLWVHPSLEHRSAELALAIAYHLPTIDYPGLAGTEEAERFGAVLLGLDREEYYSRLCALADSLH